MKVGDKYVIEIEEVMFDFNRIEKGDLARIKGFNTLVFDQCGLDKLEPYDDQKIFNMGYESGYKNGYKDGKSVVEMPEINKRDIETAYDKGLNDAWKCARKICTNWCISDACLAEIFGKGHTIDDIMRLNSASEAIAKIKEYEDKQKQDAEIKVGDEVIDYLGYKGVITKSRKGDSEFVQWMRYDGHTYGSPESSLVKTGRHFDAIAEVLAELRGEE